MIDRQLSEHFKLSEFLRSQTAERTGIDMTPPPEVIKNLERLCATVLEPVRSFFKGQTMFISSGFRPPLLNRLIGGAPTSAHIEGRAADVVFASVSPKDAIASLKGSIGTCIAVDQAIDEYDSWLHLAVAKDGERPRIQFLLATHVSAGTAYTNLD